MRQCIGAAYFLNDLTLFQLCFIIALYLPGLCGNGGMDIPCLHQIRIIYRLALLVGFQVNLSKCILFIKLPFAVLDRAQLIFMLGLLDRLQIQLILAAVNPQRRTHLCPDCFKDRLLQISHFHPYPMAGKGFCHFGVTAVKPRSISK